LIKQYEGISTEAYSCLSEQESLKANGQSGILNGKGEEGLPRFREIRGAEHKAKGVLGLENHIREAA